MYSHVVYSHVYLTYSHVVVTWSYLWKTTNRLNPGACWALNSLLLKSRKRLAYFYCTRAKPFFEPRQKVVPLIWHDLPFSTIQWLVLRLRRSWKNIFSIRPLPLKFFILFLHYLIYLGTTYPYLRLNTIELLTLLLTQKGTLRHFRYFLSSKIG